MPGNRQIVHLDADAFFASVEQAADPRLRGKPIAVGGEKRGIIAAASYEARRFGIHSAMPTARARKLCPQLILLPGDFEKYEQFSRWMFSYAYDFTPYVEVSSIDEGYMDVTTCRKPPAEVADTLRRAIRQSLKIPVSEGLAGNKLVSQIASKCRKPAAFVVVPPGEEKPFLHPLPNHWLPGIGPQAARRMNAAGLATIGQIAATPVEFLELVSGSSAPQLHAFANGIDERPLILEAAPAKSYSKQETFERDITDEALVEAVLKGMADRLMQSVRHDGKAIRTLTVKVRYNDFAEDQRSESLYEPTDLESDIYGRLRPMLKAAWRRRVSLRLVALRFSNIYDAVAPMELELWPTSQQRQTRRELAGVVDRLRETRGRYVVMRGHDLLLRTPTPEQPLVQATRPTPCAAPRHTPAAPPPLLHVHSHYSFLDSTLSPRAIADLAARQGFPAVAMTDTGNLHGLVPFQQSATSAGLRPIPGAEVQVDGRPLLLYVENETGYRHLCRLLTRGASFRHAGGQLRVAPAPDTSATRPACRSSEPEPPIDRESLAGLIAVSADPALAPLFPGAFYLGVGQPARAPAHFLDGTLPAVAVPPVHYAAPTDRRAYDIVQSIRTLSLLDHPHPTKRSGGRLHMPSPAEMAERFRAHPRLLDHAREIAGRCRYRLPLGRLQFPAFCPPDGTTPAAFLRRLTLDGLRRRYGARANGVRGRIEEELAVIHEVGYEEYFLVVWDLLQRCHARGIDWLTRGSAADSLVCYCLGISSVCPIRFDLYFRRFLNIERMSRNKLPDIDIDFPHDRKDDVNDLVFQTYGPAHVAVVGGFSTYRARSAFADVAKVLGLSEHQTRRFTERLPYAGAGDLTALVEQNIECADLPWREEPYATALSVAGLLADAPRFPKMHPCGIVLSREPMHHLTPCFLSNKGYPTTHFDMDAVEDVGLVKIDLLGQAGLATLRDAKQALARRGITIDLDALEPWEDPEVWDLISSGQARAVHHIESPAMVSLCTMCNVRDIDTLIGIVSAIRPGAANEQKKRGFTRRYQGLDPVEYPHPSVEPCLRGTHGLILYEEQVLQICEAFAGLSAGEADNLRRALGKQNWEQVQALGRRFYDAARARGHDPDTIANVWTFTCRFNGYAFCKAHSTAYGVEAYQTAWMKRYYPAAFMAAVLTHGKGFYDPLVYVLECLRLGVRLVPPSIHRPGPAFEADEREMHGALLGFTEPIIQVPLTQIKGLSAACLERIAREQARRAFDSIADFYERARPTAEEADLLMRAGAFDVFGATRTAQFWALQALRETLAPQGSAAGSNWLLPPPGDGRAPAVALTEPTRLQRLRDEMELLGFPASGHPLDLYPDIAWGTYCTVAGLREQIGKRVVCCGLIVEGRVVHEVTGEPMKFLTLADWTGLVETELFSRTYRRYGLATVRYPVLEVEATVEPFDNARGYTLRIHRAGKPRTVRKARRVEACVAGFPAREAEPLRSLQITRKSKH